MASSRQDKGCYLKVVVLHDPAGSTGEVFCGEIRTEAVSFRGINLYRDIWGVLVDMVCHKDNLRIVHVRLVKNL